MGNTYGLHFIKIGGIWIFRWGRSPLLGGLTIIEKSWNYGNLAYLVANRPTYDLNFIKIRDIWFLGGRSALLGGLTKIERSWNYGNLPHLVANTYGLNFIKIGNNWVIGGGGTETPIRGGYIWPVIPIFEFAWAIPVKSHMWKFGSDWLTLSRVIMFTNIFPWGAETPY